MIKILEGNEFLIREYIDSHIKLKFKGLNDVQLKYSIIKNPLTIDIITCNSAFALNGKVIIWDFEVFKKLEEFNPYIIPKDVDIFVIGTKIDKRSKILKSLEAFNAELIDKPFKDLYANQVEGWILLRKKKIGLNIDADSVKTLALLYGNNLGELANQMDELKKLNVPITKAIVLKTSTAVNVFSIFELQDCVTAGNTNKAIYIYRQIIKNGGSGFEILRYFITFFEKLLIIKLNNLLLIDSLKLHPYILKKFQDVKIPVEGSRKALELLRNAEAKVLKSLDINYVSERYIYELCKVK